MMSYNLLLKSDTCYHLKRICFTFLFVFTFCKCQSLTKPNLDNTAHGTDSAAVDTSFVDDTGNKYEAAVFNFCPAQCSCLDDYFECKKLNLKQVPLLPEWIRSLELTGNKLDDNVENSISNLTGLVSLNLKKNRLHKIPVFQGLTYLEKLNLAHNKIAAINIEALLSLPNLKELDLSKNLIKTILPNSFPVKNRITNLYLNYNRLSTLEENSFDHLKVLAELQLSNNNLQNLPHGIFKLLNVLKKLDLSGNEINMTWSTFKGLDDLKVLKLRLNGIRELSDGVFHALKSIIVLELDANHIQTVSRQGFFNLTSLLSISLSNNTIKNIEADAWEFTQNLIALDLSNNNLKEITRQNFDCLGKLKKLNLGHNNINHISDSAFNCTNNLEQLDLGDNKLSWVIEDGSSAFFVLKKLQKFDLSQNGIKTINQKAFIGLDNLQVLNLSNPNLTTIQFNAFEPLMQLQKLTLNSSQFLCDCNLQWLLGWLRASRISGQMSIICDYPVNLRGKELLTLREEDFMCDESPKPRLIKEPPNQLAIKGSNVTLECSAISSLPAEMVFQWRRDNVDIRMNETEYNTITSNNNTMASSYLYLWNVNHEHTGKYQCVVINTFGTTYSQRFKITVATYPGFRKIPANVTLNSGSTARLDCSAYGEPMPQIAWQKDGGNDFPAARERRMHVMPADDAFFIINAKISDVGVYTCTAENPAGIIKANATLTVYEPPTFVKPMESKEVVTGKSSVLECMSSGSPKPTLRWLKDDNPIHVTERHFFAAEGQLLIIVDTTLSDAGTYKCEMENELGTEAGYLTLKVHKAASKNVVNVEEMTGIVIITVFCCAVGTSVIWVVIIYQTKKGNELQNVNNNINNYQNNSDNNNPTIIATANSILNHDILTTSSTAQLSSGGGGGCSSNNYRLNGNTITPTSINLLEQNNHHQNHHHPQIMNHNIRHNRHTNKIFNSQQQQNSSLSLDKICDKLNIENNPSNDNHIVNNENIGDYDDDNNNNDDDDDDDDDDINIDHLSSKDSGTSDLSKRGNSSDDVTININDSYAHYTNVNNDNGSNSLKTNYNHRPIAASNRYGMLGNINANNISQNSQPQNHSKLREKLTNSINDDPSIVELSTPLITNEDNNNLNNIAVSPNISNTKVHCTNNDDDSSQQKLPSKISKKNSDLNLIQVDVR